MTQHNNIDRAFYAGLLMCWGHILYAAPSPHPSGWVDETASHSSAEVPIDSIQQFVQIYGIVRDNYVDKKSDDALFQQAIKGSVVWIAIPVICLLRNIAS